MRSAQNAHKKQDQTKENDKQRYGHNTKRGIATQAPPEPPFEVGGALEPRPRVPQPDQLQQRQREQQRHRSDQFHESRAADRATDS